MSVPMEISHRLICLNSASSVLTRVLNITVLVWLHQYLLHRIDPAEYAIYAVVMSIMVFAPLFTLVFTGGVSRYIVDGYARHDERRMTEIVSSIFPLLLAAGLALSVFGGIFTWYIDHILNITPNHLGEARLMMLMLVVVFVFQVVTAPFATGLFVTQRFVMLNTIQIGQEIIRLLLIAILLFGVSPRVLWIVVAGSVANILGLVVTIVLSLRIMPALRFAWSHCRWRTARELMSFGIWSMLGQIAYMIHNSSDTIILNKLGTPVDVSAFYLGSLFDRHVEGLSIAATGPLQPALTALHATGQKERQRDIYLNVGRYATWAALFIACPLIVFCQDLITLYVGERYLATATVLFLLLISYPISYPSMILPKLAVANARVRPFFLVSFISQIANLLLSIFFVGKMKMGAQGSALSTLIITLVSQLFFFWPMGLRMTDSSFRMFFTQVLAPGILPAITGSIVWLALANIHRPVTWFQLGAETALGYGIYGLTMYFCMKPVEQQFLGEYWQKFIFILQRTRMIPRPTND